MEVNGTETKIDFKKTNNDYDGRILYNHTDNTMKFYNNNTESFKSTDDNNVHFGKNIFGGYLFGSKDFEIGSSDSSAGTFYINKTNQRPVIIGDNTTLPDPTTGGLGIGITPEIGYKFDVYGNTNIRGQLVMGLKPFIYNQGYNAYDGVDAAVNEWVEFENIVVREL